MNKVNTAIKRCLTFITEGDGDPGLVRDELCTLESRKRDLENTRAGAHDEQAIEQHPNMADLYRKKVRELQILLADETARPQAMDLIRSMIGHIEVHVGPERSKPDVIWLSVKSWVRNRLNLLLHAPYLAVRAADS